MFVFLLAGVALEHIVDLSNRLGADAWINVHHRAGQCLLRWCCIAFSWAVSIIRCALGHNRDSSKQSCAAIQTCSTSRSKSCLHCFKQIARTLLNLQLSLVKLADASNLDFGEFS